MLQLVSLQLSVNGRIETHNYNSVFKMIFFLEYENYYLQRVENFSLSRQFLEDIAVCYFYVFYTLKYDKMNVKTVHNRSQHNETYFGNR